jgi:hypothetical protein
LLRYTNKISFFGVSRRFLRLFRAGQQRPVAFLIGRLNFRQFRAIYFMSVFLTFIPFFAFFGCCCTHTDGVRRLRREVVLLTDDRNLRVKALSRDVPVRDLPAFLAWSSSAAAASSSSSVN